ncbi:MAG: cysteine hydrolase [Chloroflexota bacterium]|nr:MAG: cysteine hydrolase [Chloroflexota bacterium]
MNEYISPDYKRVALLTIDVQRDCTIPGTPIEIPGTIDVLPKIQSVVQAFRSSQRPIIHVVRLYSPDGSNADACRRKIIELGKQILAPESDGAELMEELKPTLGIRLDAANLLKGKFQPIGSNEWIMYKPRWGAFFKTPLEKHLQDLDINTIMLCGCNFPNCPRTTIYEASERDFRIVLVEDAVSQIYKRGLQELKNIGINLVNTKEALIALAKS